MLVKDKYHLTYCTNIHPGSDWQETFQSLKQNLPDIKKEIAPHKPFGLGLRLSNQASAELGEGARLQEFKAWLEDQQCYVFTMNGFPYGAFHDQVVKDQVHAPDWTSPERLEYTKRLFRQLEKLLPSGMEGGISTSPVSYRHWHESAGDKQECLQAGARNMAEVAILLFEIEQQSGKYLHLDIEPEPDGMLENTEEVLYFFKEVLEPIAMELLQQAYKMGEEEARKIVYRYITLCYDICHFSLAYEEPANTVEKLQAAGIKIGKIQVSAALKVLFSEGEQSELLASLSRFNEPVYLHQVTEKIGEKVRTYSDLPEVLSLNREFSELRAHFHVPVFLSDFSGLHSTQDQILKVVDILKNHPLSAHLEVETYTWDVLPAELKLDLQASIIRELKWLENKLDA